MFPHQADEHIPLAAVAQGLAQQPGHYPVVQGAVGGFKDGFQDVVGPFQLIPEHQIVLAELEILDLEQVAGFGAEQVEAGEHPAAAGAGLVGNFPVVEEGGKAVVGFGNDAAVQGHGIDIVLGNDVLHQPIAGLGVKVGLESGQGRRIQSAGINLRSHKFSLRF